MSTLAHKFYAGSGVHATPPQIAQSYGPGMAKARAHNFSLPKHWVGDEVTILLLPAAIALVGVLGAIICSLVEWN